MARGDEEKRGKPGNMKEQEGKEEEEEDGRRQSKKKYEKLRLE